MRLCGPPDDRRTWTATYKVGDREVTLRYPVPGEHSPFSVGWEAPGVAYGGECPEARGGLAGAIDAAVSAATRGVPCSMGEIRNHFLKMILGSVPGGTVVDEVIG